MTARSLNDHVQRAALGLCAAAGLLLAACSSLGLNFGGPTPTPSVVPTFTPVSHPIITVVLPNKTDARGLRDEAYFKAAVLKAGYQVEIESGQSSALQDRLAPAALAARGVKVLLIAAPVSAEVAALAAQARPAGLKVVVYSSVNQPLPASGQADFFVTFDEAGIGAQQAQYLIDQAAGQANPLYLYGGAVWDEKAFQEFQSAWRVLQPKLASGLFVIQNSTQAAALLDQPSLTREAAAGILEQITTAWNSEAARQLAQANLAAGAAGAAFVLAPNDGTARALAEVFHADPRLTRLVITGLDAEKASAQAILAGRQTMTLFRDYLRLRETALQTALTALTEPPPPTPTAGTATPGAPALRVVLTPLTVVDRANLKAVLIDTGYYAAGDFPDLP